MALKRSESGWRIITIVCLMLALPVWQHAALAADTDGAGVSIVSGQHDSPELKTIQHQANAMHMAASRHRSCNHSVCPVSGCCAVAYRHVPVGLESRQPDKPVSTFAAATEFIQPAEIRPPIHIL